MFRYLRSSLRGASWLLFSAPLVVGLGFAAGCLSDNNTPAGDDGTTTGTTGGGTDTTSGGAGTDTTGGAGGSSMGTSGGSPVGAGGMPQTTTGGGSAGAMSTGAGGSGPSGGSVAGRVAAGVRWVGRIDDKTDATKPRFGWGGVGFVADVTGATLNVQVSNEKAIFFQPVVDGKPIERMKALQGMATLAIPLGAAGEHKVELYRETEASQGGVTQLVGLSGATLGAAPTYSGRLIECIGDSLSNAYGALGSEQHPNFCSTTTNGCVYSIDTQSNYQSYVAQLGRDLNADWSIVANSGWGLYRDLANGLQNVMPNVYDEAYYTGGTPPKWDFSVPASLVIINLGGNDTARGPVGTGYQTAFKALVQTVRTKYPNAWIFGMTGSMLSATATTELSGYMKAVFTELNDPKTFYVDVKQQDCTIGTGCEWHPTVKEHTRIASVLEPIIKQKLGW